MTEKIIGQVRTMSKNSVFETFSNCMPNETKFNVKRCQFTKNEPRTSKTLPHDVAILNCTLIIFIFDEFMSIYVSLH